MFKQSNLIGAVAIAFGMASSSSAMYAVNQVVDAVDPAFGAGKFIYTKHTGAAIPNGTLVTMDKNGSLTALPSTANQGVPVFVAVSDFAAGTTDAQYGWVMLQGVAPVTYSVAATVGAVYIGTAGNATPTAAAGKQVLGATCVEAATGTKTKQGHTKNGSNLLQLTDLDGLYVGMAVSGTGIPANTEITALNPDFSVTLDEEATATGTETITFTNTGYGLVRLDGAHAQGQIT